MTRAITMLMLFIGVAVFALPTPAQGAFSPLMTEANREELAVLCDDAGSIGAVIQVYQGINLGKSVAVQSAGTTPAGAPSAAAIGIGSLLEAKFWESLLNWCDLIQAISAAKDLESTVNALRVANRVLNLQLAASLEFYDDATSLYEFSENLKTRLANKSSRKSALLNAGNHARYVNAYKKWVIPMMRSEEGTGDRLARSKQAADNISYQVQAITDRVLECKKANPGVKQSTTAVTIGKVSFKTEEISAYSSALDKLETELNKQEDVIRSATEHMRSIILLLSNSGAEVYAGGKLFQSIMTKSVYVTNTYKVPIVACDAANNLNRVEEVVSGEQFRKPGIDEEEIKKAALNTRLCVDNRLIPVTFDLDPTRVDSAIKKIKRDNSLREELLKLKVDDAVARVIPLEQSANAGNIDEAVKVAAPTTRAVTVSSCMPKDEVALADEIAKEMPKGGFPDEDQKRNFINKKKEEYRACDRKPNGKTYSAAKFENINISTLQQYFNFYSKLMKSWGDLNLELTRNENAFSRASRSFGAAFNRQFDDRENVGQTIESANQLSFSGSYQFKQICSDKSYLDEKFAKNEKDKEALYANDDANATFVSLKLQCEQSLKDPKSNGDTVNLAGVAYTNAIMRYMALRGYIYALRIRHMEFAVGIVDDPASCKKTQQALDIANAQTQLMGLMVKSSVEINELQRGNIIEESVRRSAAKELAELNVAKLSTLLNKEIKKRIIDAASAPRRDTNRDRTGMNSLNTTVATDKLAQDPTTQVPKNFGRNPPSTRRPEDATAKTLQRLDNGK